MRAASVRFRAICSIRAPATPHSVEIGRFDRAPMGSEDGAAALAVPRRRGRVASPKLNCRRVPPRFAASEPSSPSMKREVLAFAVLLIVVALLSASTRWAGAIPPGFGATEQHLLLVLRVCAWAAGAALAVLLVNRLIRRRVKRRAGSEAPRLLLDLVGGAIALTAICAVAVIEFGVAPMAAVTTSGVVIAVLGFAVRHMIADLFYGVTLALERPFEIGNWIKVSDGTGDETIGRVDEFTWRAVKLVTRANLNVFVPNSIIATTRLTNFDQPEPMWRNTLRITLGYDVPVSQAERVLLSVVARVPESASLPATPEARVVEYEEYGVVWELRFWVPSYEACSRVTQRIHDALL